MTPSEVIDSFEIKGEYSTDRITSWADMERDLSAWRSNPMQHEALDRIYNLEQSVLQTGDDAVLDDWRKLTTSDHFYYMCTKYWSDGDVHKYFSPYESPSESYIYFINAINDLEYRMENKFHSQCKKVLRK